MYPQIFFKKLGHKNPIKPKDRQRPPAWFSSNCKYPHQNILPKSLEAPPPAPPEFQLRASMKKVHKYVGRMLKLVITNKRIISQSQPKPNKITKIWTNAKTIQLQFVLQSLLICFPIVLLLLPLWCWKRMKCKSNDKNIFFSFMRSDQKDFKQILGRKKNWPSAYFDATKCISSDNKIVLLQFKFYEDRKLAF